MFTRSSRYFGLPTVAAEDGAGREVKAVKLRPLGVPGGERVQVRDGDQLDVMAERRYKDGARFWHVADANSELEANELVRTTGRVIKVPTR